MAIRGNPQGGAAGQVRLAGQLVPATVVRTHPERFSQLLGRARAEVGHGECLCQPDRPQRLVIRCRAGRYHLATWPEHGHHHQAGCPWYRPDPALSGGRTATRAAIEISETGAAIRLSAPLRVRTAPIRPSPVPARDQAGATPGSSRRGLGLVALLHWLWEDSGLSTWHPQSTRRTWSACHRRLVDQTVDGTINGQRLGDVLYVVPPYRPDAADRHAAAYNRFTTRLGRRGIGRQRGLVLGEVRAVEPTEHGVRIRLAHLRAPLYASRGLLDRVRRSHRPAFAAASDTSPARRVALCLVDRSLRGYVIVEDLAVQLCTPAYIPVESGPELRMAAALIAAGRAFVKPLRYDTAAAVFPDFILVDTTPPTVVEVWGIHSRADYERRKRTKQAYYRNAGQPLLEWDTANPLPDLPLVSAGGSANADRTGRAPGEGPRKPRGRSYRVFPQA